MSTKSFFNDKLFTSRFPTQLKSIDYLKRCLYLSTYRFNQLFLIFIFSTQSSVDGISHVSEVIDISDDEPVTVEAMFNSANNKRPLPQSNCGQKSKIFKHNEENNNKNNKIKSCGGAKAKRRSKDPAIQLNEPLKTYSKDIDKRTGCSEYDSNTSSSTVVALIFPEKL